MSKIATANPRLIDVLVVGAGPTGLFLANELALYGCTFRIIDKLSGPSVHSKAFGLWHRSLEIFDNRNMMKSFTEEGIAFGGVVLRDSDEEIFGRLAFDGIVDSRFNLPMMVPQSSTEKILHEKLLEHTNGVEIVEREVELLRYEQVRLGGDDFDRIVATVKIAGKEEEIHAKFIVGCDGAHSRVRKNYKDWTYEGTTIDQEFGIVDCKIIGAEGLMTENNFASGFFSPDGIITLFPMVGKRDVCRVVVTFKSTQANPKDDVSHGVQKELKLEDVQEVLSSRLKTKITLKDPIWVTRFRLNERMANKYRYGNAFIAGDAAHCHSPMGGQGLNTGVQDAQNLGWKLHYVLHNLTPNPESLLNSYSEERLPIARAVLSGTGGATTLVLSDHWPQKFFRQNILPKVLGLRPIVSFVVNKLTAKYISYSSDAFLLNPSTWYTFLAGPSFVSAGTIAQDGPLTCSDAISSTTFYDVLRGMEEHRLVFFSGSTSVFDDNAALNFLVRASNEFSGTIKPIIITSDSVEPFKAKYPNIPVYLDADKVFHRKYGVRKDEEAMMLIRPDMFIGASVGVGENELESLEQFLDGYLVKSL